LAYGNIEQVLKTSEISCPTDYQAHALGKFCMVMVSCILVETLKVITLNMKKNYAPV